MTVSVFRGDMPEPGGECLEDAIVMGWESLNATQAQVQAAYPFIKDKFIDLVLSGSDPAALALLRQALIDHPLA